MRGRCQPLRFPEALQICCQKSAARNLTSAASAEPRSPRWHLRWRLRRRLRRRSDGCRQPAPERPPRADAPFVCLDLIGLDPHEFLSAETWKAHVQRSAVSVGSAAGRLTGTRGTSKAPVDHSLPSAGFSRPPSPPPDHRRPHQTTVIPTKGRRRSGDRPNDAATAQTTRRPPDLRAADSGRVDRVVQSLVWNQRTARVLASARVMPKWRWKRASSGSLVRGAFA